MKEYNRKEFLAPSSIRSCASYHAKIYPDMKAMFRMHDCNDGVRIWNDLNNKEEVQEMINKLRVLGTAALNFANFIENNYKVVCEHCGDPISATEPFYVTTKNKITLCNACYVEFLDNRKEEVLTD